MLVEDRVDGISSGGSYYIEGESAYVFVHNFGLSEGLGQETVCRIEEPQLRNVCFSLAWNRTREKVYKHSLL